MSLLQTWRDKAYDQNADKGALQRFWQQYFLIEKGIYEKLLTNPDEVVRGTVKELADKYEVDLMRMTGFLDGINDSLNILCAMWYLLEQNPVLHVMTGFYHIGYGEGVQQPLACPIIPQPLW